MAGKVWLTFDVSPNGLKTPTVRALANRVAMGLAKRPQPLLDQRSVGQHPSIINQSISNFVLHI
jgi:hypothetical protein